MVYIVNEKGFEAFAVAAPDAGIKALLKIFFGLIEVGILLLWKHIFWRLIGILQKINRQVGFLFYFYSVGREKFENAGHDAKTLIALAFTLDVVAGIESSGFQHLVAFIIFHHLYWILTNGALNYLEIRRGLMLNDIIK